MAKPKSHKWVFKARFRSGAFGWRGSRLACKRIKEAVSEIKKIARKNPLLAAEGAIALIQKIWPALQHVDSSSGALGTAVYNAMGVLVDFVVDAPADKKTRAKWLDRLWDAFNDDGVGYLDVLGERWGRVAPDRAQNLGRNKTGILFIFSGYQCMLILSTGGLQTPRVIGFT